VERRLSQDGARDPDANGLVARVAAEEGVELLPFHATLEDPERPGRIREEWVADGDHPSVEGYRRLAELAIVPFL